MNEPPGLAGPSGGEAARRSARRVMDVDQLGRMADHLPTLCWVAEPDGYIFWYNRRWHEYCGTTPEQMEGWGWQSVHDPARLPEVLERWNDCIASGQRFEMTFPLRGADGVLRPFLTRIEPVKDSGGRVLWWLGVNTDITLQIEAEAALRASEAQFRTFAQAMPNHVWSARPDGWLDWFNERVYEFSGKAPGELDGSEWSALVHPEDLPGAARRWATSLASGEAYETEFRLRRADGLYRWHIARALPIRDDTGAIVRWIGSNTDIEDNKRTAEALARLNATLETEVEARTADRDRLWRNSRDLLIVLDKAGVFRAASPVLTRILGWRPEEIVGRNLLDLIHADDHEASRAALARAAGDDTPSFENRYRHKEGGYRWFSWVAAPEDDLIYATGRHVTAEKEAALALQITEARIRSIFETTFQFQGFLSPEGMLLDANPASLAAIERSLGEVVGKPFWETDWFSATPGMSDEVRSGVAVAAGGQIVRREITVNLPHGPRTFDFSMKPVFDGTGAVIGIIPEAMDLTERRQAEEALRQSQKMEAVGQLTGGIAHDFNNMLAVVLGSIDLLRPRLSDDDPRAMRYADAAMEATRRAAQLTQRLLAFARRQPLRPEPIEVNRLVVGMSDLLAHSLGTDIRLESDLAADLWLVHADPNQLESTLLNLAVNARDAMPEGGRLTIETRNVHLGDGAFGPGGPPAGGYVMIAVRDTGVGMPADVAARAFDPFFTTKPVGKGTGLGLSQVYGFVNQTGGHVGIVSAPGAGATVTIHLPRTLREAKIAALAPAREGRPLAGRQELVLVVEDDPFVRQFSIEALRSLGYEVLHAGGAADALALLEVHPETKLLFTDVVMPQMSGPRLAEEALLLRPDLRVLFTTGYTGGAGLEDGDVEPGPEVIFKPFSIDDLAVKVRAVLDSPPSRRA